MKKTIHFCVLLLLVAVACGKASVEGPEENFNFDDGSGVTHGMIELGEQLEDPYSVENMTKALRSLYPTKADVIQLHATNLYVRILPRDDAELKLLDSLGIRMLDHPLDYQILREGDWYHDPSLPENSPTWQYAVIPADYKMPEGIRYELLHECYLAEEAEQTKADGIDWEEVEREAFRLTGNAEMLLPRTKAGDTPKYPQGRITILDEDYDT